MEKVKKKDLRFSKIYKIKSKPKIKMLYNKFTNMIYTFQIKLYKLFNY